ncbi:beta-ketoacyl-ACP synthase III [Shewanella surugensis]|uniref:Beta-ketoacyl-ACP synthase III n=1 Tax=Shewanella surugensis TaxID=212020 RepID=A0ABT0LCM4_9GAMM|nr:beta-ketoacyl-ACP synthase III [Shewanella surugensis]MCL1125235.1 beta-ketoacyl-ACP synthase III [Shewanella surugensis]
MKKVVISGTGLYTPEHSISNDELVISFNLYVAQFNEQHRAAIETGEIIALVKSDSAFIEKASGVKSRYVVDKKGILDPNRMKPFIPDRHNDEASLQCEMSVIAAKEALEQAGKQAQDVDMVIVACSNLQRAYPAIAIEIQTQLGIQGFAYDMNVACSSATFGIQAAMNAIQSGNARCVLMLNPEICSSHLNFRDRDSHFIFGDACTAVLLEEAEHASSNVQYLILGTKLQTVFSNNIRNNAGFLNRCDEAGLKTADKLFIQNGRKVFKEVCPMVADHISEHLHALSLTPDTISRLWLHQANLTMNQLIAKRVLGREANIHEAPIILDRYANTSSAGSIIAYHLHKSDLSSGSIGIISSFGAGYSIGSVIVKKC